LLDDFDKLLRQTEMQQNSVLSGEPGRTALVPLRLPAPPLGGETSISKSKTLSPNHRGQRPTASAHYAPEAGRRWDRSEPFQPLAACWSQWA
jgi:hypothetical protein